MDPLTPDLTVSLFSPVWEAHGIKRRSAENVFCLKARRVNLVVNFFQGSVVCFKVNTDKNDT